MLVGLAVFSLAVAVAQVSAQTTTASTERCDFTRDLELGDEGEDVRCLQRHLNAKGFRITEVGGGSSGNETTQLRDLTKEAIVRWQIANNLPSTGYFGSMSRRVYEAEISPISSNTTTPPTTPLPSFPILPAPSASPSLIPGCAGTTGYSGMTGVPCGPGVPAVNASSPTPPPPAPTTVASAPNQDERKARSLIKKVRALLDDTEDDIESAADDGENVAVATRLAEKAEEKIIDSLYAFIDQDFTEALILAERANDYLDDVQEEVGGSQEDADEAINDADDAIDEAKDAIDEADDDRRDVDEAEDLLEEAEDKFDEAREAFDDEDYSEAKDLADEAKDLADEAVDAIGN